MKRDEIVDTVIAPDFDAHRQRGSNLIRVNGREWRYLVGKTAKHEGVFLVGGGRGKNTDFNARVDDAVVNEALKAGLRPTSHVYARFNFFQSDDVYFRQICPDRILAALQ